MTRILENYEINVGDFLLNSVIIWLRFIRIQLTQILAVTFHAFVSMYYKSWRTWNILSEYFSMLYVIKYVTRLRAMELYLHGQVCINNSERIEWVLPGERSSFLTVSAAVSSTVISLLTYYIVIKVSKIVKI